MVGFPLAIAPSQMYGMNSLPPRMNADGSSIMNTLQQISGALATGIATSLMIFGSSVTEKATTLSDTQQYMQSSHYGFAMAVVLAVIGLIIAFRVKKESPVTAPHK
jgi:DHA2 family lincomycin resistance protein-like MFS transporter